MCINNVNKTVSCACVLRWDITVRWYRTVGYMETRSQVAKTEARAKMVYPKGEDDLSFSEDNFSL